MQIKSFCKRKAVQSGLSVVLAAAVILSLCLPALQRGHAEPDNPVKHARIQEIETLQMGEDKEGTGLNETGGDAVQADAAGYDTGEAGEMGSGVPETEAEPEPVKPETLESNVSGQPENGPDLDTLSQAAIGQNLAGDSDSGETEDDLQGEDGGDAVELDLGVVLNWYQYGRERRTLVCAPGQTVGKRIRQAQLNQGALDYAFSLTGSDAEYAEITSVFWAEGSGRFRGTDQRGSVPMSVPEGAESRNYIFAVTVLSQSLDPDGNEVEQELAFTFVICCETGVDLDLALKWQKADSGTGSVTCAANSTAGCTIQSRELPEGQLSYTLNLQGNHADQASILSAEYWTASGQSGQLDPAGGWIRLETPEGSKTQTYQISVTARLELHDEDGARIQEDVTYRITLVYEQTLDLSLDFTWFIKGTTASTLRCEMNDRVTGTVKNNQLSGGELLYSMELFGSSKEQATIVSASYTSEGGGSGAVATPSGSLLLSMPEGRTSASYIFTVTASVEEDGTSEQVTFTVALRYTNDLTLLMSYSVLENGSPVQKQVACENQKTKTAETVYDDQLTDGVLTYSFDLTGDDARDVTITAVECYQSGSMQTVSLSAAGTVRLLLQDGSTGENTFRIRAADGSGSSYQFTINIPYKHRGEDIIQISTNLADGQVVTNGQEVMLTVEAWTEDVHGAVVSHILANNLTVTLDGVVLQYSGTSGYLQQYTLVPENPDTGDRNTHTLHIRAEDENGNYGEKTIQFIGERSEAGQQIGTAQIYIDLTVLGLGVYGPVQYSVLSDEPVSYAVAKAVWDYDAGEPYGTAENSFGWPASLCSYSGTLDIGFYLERLGNGSLGSGANAMSGNGWRTYGSTDEEILEAIDNRFGAGSNLAILWRCIYRNGIELQTVLDRGSVGEFDFTQGSGWLYSIGGSLFYPGTPMSNYRLQDGDSLTLRYTLAYGWDVGGGSSGYGDSVGYCIRCINGTYTISHNFVEQDGNYVCTCCGIVEGCPHTGKAWTDLKDGTCAELCPDCGQMVTEAMPHTYEYSDTEDGQSHTAVCTRCGASLSEEHQWQVLGDTASCTEDGVCTMRCTVCQIEHTETSPAKGHNPENVWNYDDTGRYHLRRCQQCHEEIPETRGEHRFAYDPNWGDWVCVDCGAMHSWDTCDGAELTLVSATCLEKVYICTHCQLELKLEGTFEDGHLYVDGLCIYCGRTDPAWNPQEEPDPEGPTPEEPDPEA